jgi:predicted dehydrogenase
MIGIAVMGLGFMGRTHVRCYRAAAAAGLGCRLVAVASPDPRELAGEVAERGNLETQASGALFDRDEVAAHESAAALAADDRVHAVSICTPTDTHVELAAMFLRAGKHVLLEKPVALRSEDARTLARITAESGRICMPAMCMRFWPGWDWLKERVQDGSLGAVNSANFVRLGSRPAWSPAFYGDPARCGGAIFDLHIHDVDILYWLFGRPAAVTSAGTFDHVSTIYHFEGGPRLLTAEGGWVGAAGFPFRMRYTVEFERGVADWDLARQNQLLLTRDGRTEPVQLRDGSGYDWEIHAFVKQVITGRVGACPTLGDAVAVTEIVEAECRSLSGGARRMDL